MSRSLECTQTSAYYASSRDFAPKFSSDEPAPKSSALSALPVMLLDPTSEISAAQITPTVRLAANCMAKVQSPCV